MSDGGADRYELIISPSARRRLAETLPEAVAFAAHMLIVGALLLNPHRLGKRLQPPCKTATAPVGGTYTGHLPHRRRADDRDRVGRRSPSGRVPHEQLNPPVSRPAADRRMAPLHASRNRIGVRCCHETRRQRGRQPVCLRGPGNPRGRSGRHASMRMFVLVLVPKTTAQRVPLGDAGGSPIADPHSARRSRRPIPSAGPS